MLKTTYTGRGDTIEITDGATTLSTSFYELRDRIDQIAAVIPPPCPECEGQGDVVVEEEDENGRRYSRDIAICGACKGTRVKGTLRCEQCGEVGPGCFQFHDVVRVVVSA